MSVPLPFRKFHPDDLEQVGRLVVKTIDTCYPQFYSPRAIEFFKEYHSAKNILRDAADGLTLVAEEGGTILATGTLFGTNIRRVFVDPACQRNGLGRRIMAELEAGAVRRGLKFVDLDSSLFARRFYLSQDYLVLKDSALQLSPADSLGYTKMAKRLGPEVSPGAVLDGRTFAGTVEGEGEETRGAGSEFAFIQRGTLVYGETAGAGVLFGELVGAVEASTVDFSFIREFHGGRTDHALGSCAISTEPGGKLKLDGAMQGKNGARLRITLTEL